MPSESHWTPYSRPQLAGLIAPARLREALALPFHWIGLTTDQLLFYIGIVRSGGYDPWYWLTLRQTQVGRARERFEATAREALSALPLETREAEALAREARLNDACLAWSGTYFGDTPRYAARLAELGGDLRAFVTALRRSADTEDPRAELIGR